MNQLIQIILAAILILATASCSIGGNEGAPKETKKISLGGNKRPKKVREEKKFNDLDPMIMKGVGPITSIEIGALDDAMAAEGKELFETKCTTCHKVAKRYIGPAMKGVTERRTPEWIMNMILNPMKMIKEDSLAKQVMIESNMAIMVKQGITEDQARKIYEYFRTK